MEFSCNSQFFSVQSGFFQHAAPWNLSAVLVEKGEIISMERPSSLGVISELR
jgi:hypothetical protein